MEMRKIIGAIHFKSRVHISLLLEEKNLSILMARASMTLVIYFLVRRDVSDVIDLYCNCKQTRKVLHKI